MSNEEAKPLCQDVEGNDVYPGDTLVYVGKMYGSGWKPQLTFGVVRSMTKGGQPRVEQTWLTVEGQETVERAIGQTDFLKVRGGQE